MKWIMSNLINLLLYIHVGYQEIAIMPNNFGNEFEELRVTLVEICLT